MASLVLYITEVSPLSRLFVSVILELISSCISSECSKALNISVLQKVNSSCISPEARLLARYALEICRMSGQPFLDIGIPALKVTGVLAQPASLAAPLAFLLAAELKTDPLASANTLIRNKRRMTDQTALALRIVHGSNSILISKYRIRPPALRKEPIFKEQQSKQSNNNNQTELNTGVTHNA